MPTTARTLFELAVAHEPAGGRPAEQIRAEAAAMMDARAATGEPYLFIGLPSSVTGPYDDVVLPSWCAQPDWELELAAVIGAPAWRVTVEQAPRHIAGYTIANDITARDQVFRRDMPGIGTDWLRGKNAPGWRGLGQGAAARRHDGGDDHRARYPANSVRGGGGVR